MIDWDALRWVNAIVAALVVVLMTIDTIHRWDELTLRLRRVMPWVICTYVAIAYGSGEVAAKSDVDPGLHVTFMFLTLTGLVIAMLYRMNDDADSP